MINRRALLALPLISAGCLPQPVPAVVALRIDTADLRALIQQHAMEIEVAQMLCAGPDMIARLLTVHAEERRIAVQAAVSVEGRA